MKTLLASTVAVAVGSGLFLTTPAQASTTSSPVAAASAATSAVEPLSAPVTGSFTDASGAPGVFAGTFTPTGFAESGDEVVATGTLTGALTDSTGTQLGTVEQAISTPLDRSASTEATGADAAALPVPACQILDLRLQPLDLDLLGLVVHLDTVHLNISAEPGSGNLLGNLLCALTGLLDGAGALAQIAALLNQILAIINGGL